MLKSLFILFYQNWVFIFWINSGFNGLNNRGMENKYGNKRKNPVDKMRQQNIRHI